LTNDYQQHPRDLAVGTLWNAGGAAELAPAVLKAGWQQFDFATGLVTTRIKPLLALAEKIARLYLNNCRCPKILKESKLLSS